MTLFRFAGPLLSGVMKSLYKFCKMGICNLLQVHGCEVVRTQRKDFGREKKVAAFPAHISQLLERNQRTANRSCAQACSH